MKIVVESSDDGGFFVECPSLQGCYTSGKTFDEAMNHIREAIRAHIEDRITDGESVPKEVDLSEAVETMVSVTL